MAFFVSLSGLVFFFSFSLALFFPVCLFTFGPRPAFQANYFLGIVISVGIAWSLHLATGPLCFGGGRVWLQGSLYLPMVPFGSKPPYALLPALGPKGAGRAVGELQLRGGDLWGVGRNRFLGTTKGCVPCSGGPGGPCCVWAVLGRPRWAWPVCFFLLGRSIVGCVCCLGVWVRQSSCTCSWYRGHGA